MTAGSGVMWLGEERFVITAGDTIAIPTGVAHAVENKGRATGTALLLCAPLFPRDTELLEEFSSS